MKAAWYERQGPVREVLTVWEMPKPNAAPGEVRIRIAASGIKARRHQETLERIWILHAVPTRHSPQRRRWACGPSGATFWRASGDLMARAKNISFLSR